MKLNSERLLKNRICFITLYILFVTFKVLLYHRQSSEFNLPSTEMELEDRNMPDNFPIFGRRLMTINIIRPHPSLNCTPLAMNNFPKDIFTQIQRQKGAVIIHLFVSIYMFIALGILCDDYFIPCLEKICEVLNLQPDVAGATFMAAGSSAPELATTLVGVFIAKDDIGLGTVVGSADFNIMFVVSVTALFAKQVIYLNWWPLVRDCTVYLLSIILLSLAIYDELIYWYESAIFLLFYGLYVLLMYFNPRIDRFLRGWCRRHPNCCVRVHHSIEEEQGFVQQRTGAFGYKLNGDDHLSGITSVLNSSLFNEREEKSSEIYAAYERLDCENTGDDAQRCLNTPETNFETGLTNISLKDSYPTIGVNQSEVQIHDRSEDSWYETCFGPLRLPSRQGIRGKIRFAFCVLVWPIRLVLTLTTPDVRKPKWRSVPASHWLSFIMSCIWIGLFTVIMMWMITVLGVTLHIPDTIMGLTLIAAGSSVPDAITSVLVVREGEGDMAVSNAVGSNVFDILVCMGLPWLMKSIISQAPVVIYSKGLLYATLTLFSTVVFLLAVTHMNRWRLTKLYGYVLLVGYVVVLVFCSLYELNYFGNVRLPECLLNE